MRYISRIISFITGHKSKSISISISSTIDQDDSLWKIIRRVGEMVRNDLRSR